MRRESVRREDIQSASGVPRMSRHSVVTEASRSVRPSAARSMGGSVAGALCRRWDDAELRHHAEGVHEDAAVGHARVDDAVDDNAFDGDRATGGRDTKEVAAVRAGPGKVRDDFFARGDGLVGHPMDIWKRGAQRGDDLFEAFAALALAGERVELEKVFGDDVVADLVAAMVDDVIDKAPDDRSVVGGHAAPVVCERQRHRTSLVLRAVSYFAGSRPKDLSCC